MGAGILLRGTGMADYVTCCTLGQSVPGLEDVLWGTEKIFDLMRQLPGYPNVATIC